MVQVNQRAYLTISNRIIQPVTILRISDKKCLVQLERSGEMWVEDRRLFPSREDAENSLQKKFTLQQPKVFTYIDKMRVRSH